MRYVALVLLIGCGAAAPRRTTLQPLGEAVTLTEVTQEGVRIPISGDGVADVDINSRIEVHVDRARVEESFLREQTASGAEVVRVKAQLQELAELTRRQQQMLMQLVDLKDALTQEGPTSIPSQSLQDAVQRFYIALKPLNEAIAHYAVSAGQQPAAYFAGSGHEGTFEALGEERRRVLAEAEAIASGSGLRWRMQAVFANNKPIHLHNYDTYPDGPFAVVDKLEPQTTTKELSAQFEEAKQLTRDLKNLSGLKETLVRSAVNALQGMLKSLQDAVHDDFAALKPLVKAIPDNALAIPDVIAVKEQLAGLIATLGDLQTACSSVLDAIKKGSLDRVNLNQGEVCIRAVMQHGSTLVTQAKSAGQAVAALTELVRSNPGKLGALLQPITDLLPRLDTVKQLKQWGQDVERGWKDLEAFLGANAVAASATTWSDTQLTDHTLAEITDTAIDLRRTERKENDLLYFRPSIITKEGSATVLGATHDLRVVRMGPYLDVSAGVGFVDAKNDAWGPFTAAPAIVAALHYRLRPDDRPSRLFNAIRPGLGIHFLYPDLGTREVSAMGVVTGEDPSFELGVGGTMTLFGDLLQVGVGYDLQVKTSYWYLGFGLDTLAKLRVRFSPGS